jgi:pimeloyl-ACP methyl ester carboxylesterase
MYSQTLPHLLTSVKAPTRMIWGDKDKIVPVATAKRFQAALPNATLEVIEDCGHCVELERPEELARLVMPFIAR